MEADDSWAFRRLVKQPWRRAVEATRTQISRFPVRFLLSVIRGEKRYRVYVIGCKRYRAGFSGIPAPSAAYRRGDLGRHLLHGFRRQRKVLRVFLLGKDISSVRECRCWEGWFFRHFVVWSSMRQGCWGDKDTDTMVPRSVPPSVICGKKDIECAQ